MSRRFLRGNKQCGNLFTVTKSIQNGMFRAVWQTANSVPTSAHWVQATKFAEIRSITNQIRQRKRQCIREYRFDNIEIKLVQEKNHEYLLTKIIITTACEKRWNASGLFVSSARRRNNKQGLHFFYMAHASDVIISILLQNIDIF